MAPDSTFLERVQLLEVLHTPVRHQLGAPKVDPRDSIHPCILALFSPTAIS